MGPSGVLGAALLWFAVGNTPILFVHQTPVPQQAARPVRVEGQMLGASRIARAELWYRSNTGNHTASESDWQQTPLVLLYGDTYRAVIPAQDVAAPTLHYAVAVYDHLGHRSYAFASLKHPQAVVVHGTAAVTKPNTGWSQTAKPAQLSATGNTATHTAQVAPTDARTSSTATARRVAKPNAPTSKAPAPWQPALEGSEIIWDEARIEAMGAMTLVDVLRRMPGLYVRQTVDGHVHINLGGSDRHAAVLVTLDGQPVHDPFNQRAWLTWPAHQIHRITLQRAPQANPLLPTLYRGHLAIQTRAANRNKRPIAQAQMIAGSHVQQETRELQQRGSYQVTTQGSWHNRKLSLSGFAFTDLSDGSQRQVRTVTPNTITGQPPLTAGSPATNAQQGGPLRDHRALAGVGTQLQIGTNPKHRAGVLTLDSKYLYAEQGAHIGTSHTYGPGGTQRAHLGLLQAHHRRRFAHARWGPVTWQSTAQLALQHQTTVTQWTPANTLLPDAPSDADDRAELFVQGVRGQEQRLGTTLMAGTSLNLTPHQNHQVQVGVGLQHAMIPSRTLRRNSDAQGGAQPGLQPLAATGITAPGVGLDRTTAWATVGHRWQLLSALELDYGLRATYLTQAGRWRATDLLNPHVSLRATPRRHWNLDLTYHSTHRPASLAERGDISADSLPAALQTAARRGNPGLSVAHAHQVSLGQTYRHHRGKEWSWSLHTGAHYSYLRRGLVELVQTPQTPAQRQRQHHVAASLAWTATWAPYLAVETQAWWQRQWDAHQSSQLLRDIPELSVSSTVQTRWPKVATLSLTAHVQSARQNNRRAASGQVRELGAYKIGPQVVLDAALHSPWLHNSVRLGVLGRNILNSDERDPVPRPDLMPGLLPLPGAQVLATVEAAL